MWRHTRRTRPALRGNEAFNQKLLKNSMRKNSSTPCRITFVRPGLSLARRARARVRRQRLLMFRIARIDWMNWERTNKSMVGVDICDVNLDYHVTESKEDAIHVLMTACKRDKVANLKQAIQLAGKQPAVIDVDAFALQNCYELNYDPQPTEVVALLNIGASTTNINILIGNRSVFTRDATFGGSQYTSLLQKELGLTFEHAEQIKRGMPLPENLEHREIAPILETVSDILALEVQKTVEFYRATVEEGGSAVEKILVSGGGSKLAGLINFLAKQFEIPVEIFDPFRKIKVDSRGFDPEYMREVVPEMAIAVCLALRVGDA